MFNISCENKKTRNRFKASLNLSATDLFEMTELNYVD